MWRCVAQAVPFITTESYSFCCKHCLPKPGGHTSSSEAGSLETFEQIKPSWLMCIKSGLAYLMYASPRASPC